MAGFFDRKNGLYVWGATKSLEPLENWLRTNKEDLARTPGAAYGLVPWVYRCVHLRAHAVSSMPVVIQWTEGPEKGTPVPDEEIPWKKHLKRLLWLTEASLCSHGRAYWFYQQNLVVPLGMQYVCPTTVTERYNRQGIVGFERRFMPPRWRAPFAREEASVPGSWEESLNDRGTPLGPGVGQAQQLESHELIHFHYPDPEVEIGPGRSPVQVALESASLARSVGVFSTAFFDRACIPATVLQVSGNPSEQEQRRLEAGWKRLLRGTGSAVKRAWETIAVSDKVKPLVVGAPIRDLGMPTLKELVRREICAALGVPVTLLSDSANYACVVGETRVQTEGGSLAIREIRPGMRVWTSDAAAKSKAERAVLREVTAVIPQGEAPIFTLRIAGTYMLRATGNHRVLLEETREGWLSGDLRERGGRLWRRVDQLTPGDTVQINHYFPRYPGHVPRFLGGAVESVTPAGTAEVFDLTVEGTHNFLAEGIVTHNTAKEHRKSFYSETAIPEAELIAETINEQFLNPRRMEIAFLPEQMEVMQQDEVERAGALVTLRNAGVPLLQAMKILGYDMDRETEEELRGFVGKRDEEYEEARSQAAARRRIQQTMEQVQQPQALSQDARNFIRHQTPPIEQALNANGLGRRYEP